MIGAATISALRRGARRLPPRAEEGFTLIEVLVVMIVLMAVLAPLTASFVSAQTAQVDQTRRMDAQENARKRRDEVVALGFPARMAERLETTPSYWLDVVVGDDAKVNWQARARAPAFRRLNKKRQRRAKLP